MSGALAWLSMDLRFTDPTPQRFVLLRSEDVSGISGVGKVASGCVFPDGSAVLHWNTDIFTTTLFEKFSDLEQLHGHNSATTVQWVDEELDEFTETDVWSRQSVDGERQTWRQLYERTLTDNLALQRRSAILGDLDRCEHGRHAADNCFGCEGQSHGNPRLSDDRIIGYDISGNPWRVPDHTSAPARKWH
jgi:hypothetical protein